MKRLFGCAALVLTLLFFSLYGFSYVKDMTEEILDTVKTVAEKYEQRLFDEASEIAETARERWHILSEGTVLLDDRDYGIELNSLLARAAVLAKQKNDDIYAELKSAECLLRAFIQRQCPSIENIL